MEKKVHFKNVPAFLGVAAFFWIGPAASAQTQDSNPPPRTADTRSSDTTRAELRSFDQFLDRHREIGEQLERDPALVNNSQFVKNHPALENYLKQHPGVREEITENPSAFMRQENRYDRSEDARDRDLNRPDNERRDVDTHEPNNRPNDNRATTGNSSGAGTAAATASPNAAGTRSATNPGVPTTTAGATRTAAGASSNSQSTAATSSPSQSRDAQDTASPPSARGDERQGGQADPNGELARFDQFLDSHREISEPLRRDPSLANNRQYLLNHPALESYLADHPAIREQLTQHPDAFMEREERYDTREDARNNDRRDFEQRQDNRERSGNRDELASFDRFLDSHREEGEQLHRDPSLANNKQFVANHPALGTYLEGHPGVREQLAQDPNGFMREEDRYDRQEDMDRSHPKQAANFRDFLGGHSGISQDLSRNPMKANDPDYRRSHPELEAYLNAHPDVQSALHENPQSFMKTVQQPAAAPTTTGTAAAPATGATGAVKPPQAPKPPMR
jgi:hypothetical protein